MAERTGVVDRIAGDALRLHVSAGEWDAAGDVGDATPGVMLLAGSERALGAGTDIGVEADGRSLEAVWTELFGAVAAVAAQMADPQEARREIGYGLVNVVYAQVARIERRIGETVAQSCEIAERLERAGGSSARRTELEAQAEDLAEQLDVLSRRRAAIDTWAGVAAQQYRVLIGEGWIDRQAGRSQAEPGDGRRETWESLAVLSSIGAPWHQVIGALEAAREQHGEDMTLVVGTIDPPDVMRAVRHWAGFHDVGLLGEGTERALPASWEGDVLAPRPRLVILMGSADRSDLAQRTRALGAQVLDVSDRAGLEEAGRRYRERTRPADQVQARNVVVRDAIEEWGRRAGAPPLRAGLAQTEPPDRPTPTAGSPALGSKSGWGSVRQRVERALSALDALVPEGSGLEDMTAQLRWGVVNAIVLQASHTVRRLEDLADTIEAGDERKLDALLAVGADAHGYAGVLDARGIVAVRERLPLHFPPAGRIRSADAVPVLVTCRGNMPVEGRELGSALDRIHEKRPGLAVVVTDSNQDRLARQVVSWASGRGVPFVWAKTDWSNGSADRRAMFRRNEGLLELGVAGVLEFRTLGWERGVPGEERAARPTAEMDGPTMNLVDRLRDPVGPYRVGLAVASAGGPVFRHEGELDRAARRRLATAMPECFAGDGGGVVLVGSAGAPPDGSAVRDGLDRQWGDGTAGEGRALPGALVVDGSDPAAGVVNEWARDRRVPLVIAGRLGQAPLDQSERRERQIAGLGIASAVQFRAAEPAVVKEDGAEACVPVPDSALVRRLAAVPVVRLDVPAGEGVREAESRAVQERVASRLRVDQVARAGQAWDDARAQASTYAVLAETARAVYGEVTGEQWRPGSRQVADPVAAVFRPPPEALARVSAAEDGRADLIEEWEQAVVGLGEVDRKKRPDLREALLDRATDLYHRVLVSRDGPRLQDNALLRVFHQLRGVGDEPADTAMKAR